MFKTIKNLFSVTISATNTTLNVVNKGLEKANESLENFNTWADKDIELGKLARQVFSKEISIREAQAKVVNTFGMEYLNDFEFKLDRFRESAYKLESYLVLGMNEKGEIKDKEDSIKEMKQLFGKINEKSFEWEILQRRRSAIELLSSEKLSRYDLEKKSNRELAEMYQKRVKKLYEEIEELDAILKIGIKAK